MLPLPLLGGNFVSSKQAKGAQRLISNHKGILSRAPLADVQIRNICEALTSNQTVEKLKNIISRSLFWGEISEKLIKYHSDEIEEKLVYYFVRNQCIDYLRSRNFSQDAMKELDINKAVQKKMKEKAEELMKLEKEGLI